MTFMIHSGTASRSPFFWLSESLSEVSSITLLIFGMDLDPFYLPSPKREISPLPILYVQLLPSRLVRSVPSNFRGPVRRSFSSLISLALGGTFLPDFFLFHLLLDGEYIDFLKK